VTAAATAALGAAPPPLPAFFTLAAVDRIDSTNEEARRRAGAGAGEGLLVWAGEQTLGRGRQGRRWSSPPGNLYCSLLLRPPVTPAKAAQLSFVAVLAAADAVEAALAHARPRPDLRCKWPNDVLIDGRKCAGILLESSTAADGRLEWVVVGCGINVASHPESPDYPVTSIKAAGGASDLAGLLRSYAMRFLHWLTLWRDAGFEPLRAAWLARAGAAGHAMRVRLGQTTVEGSFETIDAGGALVLGLEGGRRRVIAAGEVMI
jgi:BirA family biotin operon repressor/biotin-[acetyl-CoA-carboxylase] ligase